MQPAVPTAIDTQVLKQVSVAIEVMRQALDGDHEYPAHSLSVFIAAALHEGATVGELSEAVGIPQMYVARALHWFEKKALLRVGSTRSLVYLTANGRELAVHLGELLGGR